MADPTPTYPVELQNQAAADKLLEQHKITDVLVSFPIAKLKVLDGNRPLNEAHLAQLRTSMAGRIEPNRAPCQLVFRVAEGSLKTAEEGRELYNRLKAEAVAEGVADHLDWIYKAFTVGVWVHVVLNPPCLLLGPTPLWANGFEPFPGRDLWRSASGQDPAGEGTHVRGSDVAVRVLLPE